jgi:hypothetical protein
MCSQAGLPFAAQIYGSDRRFYNALCGYFRGQLPLLCCVLLVRCILLIWTQKVHTGHYHEPRHQAEHIGSWYMSLFFLSSFVWEQHYTFHTQATMIPRRLTHRNIHVVHGVSLRI